MVTRAVSRLNKFSMSDRLANIGNRNPSTAFDGYANFLEKKGSRK